MFTRGFSLVVSMMLLTSCGFMKPENLKMINAKDLDMTMQQNDILLVDVHIPTQAHIVGTDFHAPFYKVDDYLEKFPIAKDSAIYLYCESGPMGNWAARTLFDLGYTNIYNLTGGADAWIESGRKVIDPDS